MSVKKRNENFRNINQRRVWDERQQRWVNPNEVEEEDEYYYYEEEVPQNQYQFNRPPYQMNQQQQQMNQQQHQMNQQQQQMNQDGSDEYYYVDEFGNEIPSQNNPPQNMNTNHNLPQQNNIYGMNQQHQQTVMNMNRNQPTMPQQFNQRNPNQLPGLKNGNAAIIPYNQPVAVKNQPAAVQTAMYQAADSQPYQQPNKMNTNYNAMTKNQNMNMTTNNNNQSMPTLQQMKNLRLQETPKTTLQYGNQQQMQLPKPEKMIPNLQAHDLNIDQLRTDWTNAFKELKVVIKDAYREVGSFIKDGKRKRGKTGISIVQEQINHLEQITNLSIKDQEFKHFNDFWSKQFTEEKIFLAVALHPNGSAHIPELLARMQNFQTITNKCAQNLSILK